MGAQVVDALSAHAIQSYEGAARLLTFKGGDPLPWPAMVLARTSLEASLKMIYILNMNLSDNEMLAHIGALRLDDLNQHRKRHEGLGDQIKADALHANEVRTKNLLQTLTDAGLTIERGNGGGGVVRTSEGLKVQFPINIFELADTFSKTNAGFMYRWLCTFTHASPSTPLEPETGVAALDEADVVVTFALLTDVLWAAFDEYSRWIGMPNNMFFWSIRRVWKLLVLHSRSGPLPMSQNNAGQAYISWVADAARDEGLMSERAVRKFLRRYARRLE